MRFGGLMASSHKCSALPLFQPEVQDLNAQQQNLLITLFNEFTDNFYFMKVKRAIPTKILLDMSKLNFGSSENEWITEHFDIYVESLECWRVSFSHISAEIGKFLMSKQIFFLFLPFNFNLGNGVINCHQCNFSRASDDNHNFHFVVVFSI